MGCGGSQPQPKRPPSLAWELSPACIRSTDPLMPAALSKALPEASTLSSYFLGDYLEGLPAQVHGYTKDTVDGERPASVLVHVATGARVWAEALDLRFAALSSRDDEPHLVLFHYTCRQGFSCVAQHGFTDPELLASLSDADGVGPGRCLLDASWTSELPSASSRSGAGSQDSGVGKGSLACYKDPASFRSSAELLLNKYLPTHMRLDEEGQHTTRASTLEQFSGQADFCVPMLVPRSLAQDLHDSQGEVAASEVVAQDRDLWRLSLTEEGMSRLRQARCEGKVRILEKRVAHLQVSMGLMHADTMAALQDLVVLLKSAKREAEAEPHLRAALKTIEATGGLDRPEAWKAFGHLAAMLAIIGKFEGVEPRLCAAVLGPTQPSSRFSMNNFIGLVHAKGALQTELDMRSALAGKEVTLGPNHPSTLATLNNLARFLQATGNASEAETMLRRGLHGSEASLGISSLSTLTFLNNTALVLQAGNGEHQEEAMVCLRRALQGFKAILGPCHRSSLICTNNYGALMEDSGKKHEAEDLYRSAFRGAESSLGLLHPETLRYLDDLSRILRAGGKEDEAEAPLRKALRISEDRFGSGHATTLVVLHKLAALLACSDERSAEAQVMYASALSDSKANLGPRHPMTLSLSEDLAMLQHAQGNNQEAQHLLQAVLAVYEEEGGEDEFTTQGNTLTTLGNLARVMEAVGEYQQAEAASRRVVVGYSDWLGPGHADTLTARHNLASLLQTMGRQDEAEKGFREALSGRERTLGLNHSSTLTSANNLAMLLKKMGRPDEAEPIMWRVQLGREATLGPSHASTLMSLNNLAMLLDSMGKQDQAEPLLRRALATSETTAGPQNQSTLTFLGNLGMLLQGLGRQSEAEPMLRRALEVSKTTLGPSHPSSLTFCNNLAMLLQAMGRLQDAEVLIREAVDGRYKTLGQQHPSTLTSVNNLAALLEEMGREDEAEPMYRETYDTSKVALGATHPCTLTAINNLAMLLQKREDRREEAEKLLKLAVDGYGRTLGPTHPDTLTAVRNLKELLEAIGKTEEANELANLLEDSAALQPPSCAMM